MKKIVLAGALLLIPLFILMMAGTAIAECGCGKGIECKGGVECVFGVCLGACMSGSGERCGGSPVAYCKSGLDCVSGKCKTKGSLGTGCATNSNCNSGLYCDLFKCKNKKGEGGSCSADWVCKSGLECMTFTCQNPGAEGSSCTTNAECDSGLYCELFKCEKKKDAGEYCGIADYECKTDLVCVDFYCEKKGDSKDRCIGIGQGSCKSGLVCDFYGECRHDPPLVGEVCDKKNPIVPVCAEGLFCNILRCDEGRKAGEQCFASGDCVSGLECKMCLSENCNYASQCFPQPGHEIIDKTACLAVYSKSTHKTAKDGEITMNFGAGSAATVGVGATDEIGTVYGQDGRYGCYLSYCTGGEISVGISDFATVGIYNSYDAFTNGATYTTQSAGVGEFVSISTSQVFDRAGNLAGTQDNLSFGAGVAPPLTAGYYSCNTVVRTVIDSSDSTPDDEEPDSTSPTTPNTTPGLGDPPIAPPTLGIPPIAPPTLGDPLTAPPLLGDPLTNPQISTMTDANPPAPVTGGPLTSPPTTGEPLINQPTLGNSPIAQPSLGDPLTNPQISTMTDPNPQAPTSSPLTSPQASQPASQPASISPPTVAEENVISAVINWLKNIDWLKNIIN